MRFITEDTNKGDVKDPLSLNLYVYCQGNPVRYYDYSGNNSDDDPMGLMVNNLPSIPMNSGALDGMFDMLDQELARLLSTFEVFRNITKSEINYMVTSVPGRVQSRINIMNGSKEAKMGFEHVLDRHFNPSKNASQFTISPGELKTILQSKEVIQTPITRILMSKDGLRYLREVKLDIIIGNDKFINFQPTNIMTILTDKYGNLITVTPGVIK